MKTATIACVLAVSALAPPAFCGENNTWSVAGTAVLRLHATAAGMSPEKRVEALDERLTNILSHGNGKLSAEDIVIRTNRAVTSILARGELLVTVAAEDAAANHTTCERLARRWLSNLRKTLPQLAPRVNRRGA